MCFYSFRTSKTKYQLTNELKRQAVLFVIHANHGDVRIVFFFVEVARSFVYKVRKELEASIGEVSSTGVIARDLQVSEGRIRNLAHEDIRYKSYVMRKKAAHAK